MSGTFGRDFYGAGLYGRSSPSFPVNVPTQIHVWDVNLNFKAVYQVGSCALISMEFAHGVKGCQDFSLQFAESVDIAKNDRIKINLFNSSQYFYTGVVRTIPIPGSTKKGFEYSGFGFNDYFQRLNTGYLSYASKSIAYILMDVINNVLLLKSPILYSNDRINPPNITITSMVANYGQISDVFDALIKIANSTGTEYNCGVDKDGYFFFLPRSDETKVILTVGRSGKYGIQSYEPEDKNEARTKIILLDKNGTYISTLNSALNNETWEEKVSAPDISNSDALLWAAGILADKERTTRSASIEWLIESDFPEVVVADGYIRVISNIPPSKQVTVSGNNWGDGLWGDGLWGGGPSLQWTTIDDTLSIIQIKYKITGQKISRSIELGALPLRVENLVSDINQRITDLSINLGV
jgi:hypothetical protein